MTNPPATVALRGHAEIRAAVAAHVDRFVQHPTPQDAARAAAGRRPFRPESHYGYVQDRCAVLDAAALPSALHRRITEVFARSGIRTPESRFSFVRYEPGDYLRPHRDDSAVSLFALTSSDEDGLVAQRDGRGFVRIPDRAGRHVVLLPGQWHWVDPVRAPRLTLVVTPRLTIPEG